jgi:hypothetical protein
VHAENCTGMPWIKPVRRFGGLAQILWIRAVAYDSLVLGRTARVVTCPGDNRKIGVSSFNLWPLGNPNGGSFLCGRTQLRDCWDREEQDTNCYRRPTFKSSSFIDRPPAESFNSYLGKEDKRGMGSVAPCLRYWLPLIPPIRSLSILALRNRLSGKRRNTANSGCTRRSVGSRQVRNHCSAKSVADDEH